jgi:hypothetical protein
MWVLLLIFLVPYLVYRYKKHTSGVYLMSKSGIQRTGFIKKNVFGRRIASYWMPSEYGWFPTAYRVELLDNGTVQNVSSRYGHEIEKWKYCNEKKNKVNDSGTN